MQSHPLDRIPPQIDPASDRSVMGRASTLAGLVVDQLTRHFPGSLAAIFVRSPERDFSGIDRPLIARAPTGTEAIPEAARAFPAAWRDEVRRTGKPRTSLFELTPDQYLRTGIVSIRLSSGISRTEGMDPVLCVRQQVSTAQPFTAEEVSSLEYHASLVALVMEGVEAADSHARACRTVQEMERLQAILVKRMEDLRHVAGCLAEIRPDQDLVHAVIMHATERISRALSTREIVVLLSHPEGARLFSRRDGSSIGDHSPGKSPLLQQSAGHVLDLWPARPSVPGVEEDDPERDVELTELREATLESGGRFTTGLVRGHHPRHRRPVPALDPSSHHVVLQWGSWHQRTVLGVLSASRDSGPLLESDRSFLDAAAKVMIAVLQIAFLPGSKDLFEELLSAMDDCVFVVDRNAEVEFSNPSATKILGLEAGCNLRHTPHALLLAAWQKSLETGEHDVLPDRLLHCAGGGSEKTRSFHVTTSVLGSPGEPARGVLFDLRDVFWQRYIVQSSLHDALASVGEVSLALDSVKACDGRDEGLLTLCLERCRAASNSMGLMKRLLLPSGLKGLELQRCNLDEILEKALKWWRLSPEFSIEVTGSTRESIVCSPELLTNAVDNVFRNARKHGMRGGNTLRIGIQIDSGDVASVCRYLPDRLAEEMASVLDETGKTSWALLLVRDDGAGVQAGEIPEGAALGQLGASRLGSGHGTGLAFIHWVAQVHGGFSRAFDRRQAADGPSGFGLALFLTVDGPGT